MFSKTVLEKKKLKLFLNGKLILVIDSSRHSIGESSDIGVRRTLMPENVMFFSGPDALRSYNASKRLNNVRRCSSA
jgi:hypothetical protein